MTREEIKEGLKFTVDMFKFDPLTGGERTLNELDATTVNACEEAIKVIDDFEALNEINLDLASENEDLVERIGKLIGYIDFLRNVGTGKKKSLDYLEKVVKGQIKEIRAEGENFVKPKTGEWIPVTEKLPKEESNTYWVCTHNGCQCECRWTNVSPFWSYETTDWHWNTSDIPQYTKVVAWMPLPKPYGLESEEV